VSRKAILTPIPAGEICIKIFCEISHNPETNSRSQKETYITKIRGFCFFSRHRIFFAHLFCDSDHHEGRHTPCIYVMGIT